MATDDLTPEERAVMAKVGRKGGVTTRDRFGSEHMREIGRKGGKTVKLRGSEYMAKIGARGGAKVRERGISYYEAIGTKGGAVSHQKRLDLEAQLDERVKENKE